MPGALDTRFPTRPFARELEIAVANFTIAPVRRYVQFLHVLGYHALAVEMWTDITEDTVSFFVTIRPGPVFPAGMIHRHDLVFKQ